MSIQISHESELGKELAKWEQHRTKYVGEDQVPGNPYVYRPYPKMLYKAEKRPDGRHVCLADPPHPYAYERMDLLAQAQLAMDAWNAAHQRTVQSEADETRARAEGWRESPPAALAYLEALEQDISRAAAEAAHAVQRMSDKARAEFARAEDSTHEHVTDVRPKRRNRRGRPRKIVAVSSAPIEAE